MDQEDIRVYSLLLDACIEDVLMRWTYHTGALRVALRDATRHGLDKGVVDEGIVV